MASGWGNLPSVLQFGEGAADLGNKCGNLAKMALRTAILKHLRVSARSQRVDRAASNRRWGLFTSIRLLSSHGDQHPDKNEVTERVLSVIKSFPKVDPSKVTPDVHFQKDLGLDSLDTVEIVIALEEEFKLEIPDKEADKIASCSLAIDYIYNHPMTS